MFQPVIPTGGLAGWRFLQKTYDHQREAFNKSAQLNRATDYFRENIGKVTSAKELVDDRQLLGVALGAFGLQDDINNKFFIQKILEEGTTVDDALANRFTDKRYKELSEAFGLGPNEFSQTSLFSFADKIVSLYEATSFEEATGNVDETLRIALYAERKLPSLAAENSSEKAKWFSIMGESPLRAVFDTVFGLPSAFGQQDIDKQREVFQERAERMFGSSDPAQFSDPEVLQDLMTKYVALSQIKAFNTNTSSASLALMLLQS
jgi:hypothetical protein